MDISSSWDSNTGCFCFSFLNFMSETLWVSVSNSGVTTNLVIQAAELAQMGETLARPSRWRLRQKKHWVHQCFFDLVGRSGIEPLASTVWRWHSTAELTTQILYCWLHLRTKLFTLLLEWLNYHRHTQNHLLFCTQNLRKDIEKSMTSSIVGLYYYFPLK